MRIIRKGDLIHIINALIILTTVNLITGCSGCSKSGRIRQSSFNVSTSAINNIEEDDNDNLENNAKSNSELNSFHKSVNSISGTVYSIIDGDTYDMLIEGNKIIRIRMEGIDAPESGMPYYQVSKNYLGRLCFDKIVKVQITGKDNNRYLGYTYLNDGTELSHEMIKAGLAWHYKKYNTNQELSDLEIVARNSKIGLWKDTNPMPPWTNRSLHSRGISTKNLFD